MEQKLCPICLKSSCRMNAKLTKGFCKTEKQKWKRIKIPRGKIRPGPIQHEEIPDFLNPIVAWTFRITGHYLVTTLEEWELGFMRDIHITREIAFWHRLSLAFISYHRRRKIGLQTDAEERRLIGAFIHEGTVHPPEKKETEEQRFLRDCWENPDALEETQKSIEGFNQGIPWTPPNISIG